MDRDSLVDQLASRSLLVLGNRLNQNVETKLKENKGAEKNAKLLDEDAINVSKICASNDPEFVIWNVFSADQ